MPRSSGVDVRAEEAPPPVRFSIDTLRLRTGPGPELYTLPGHTLALPVAHGRLVLGRFQSIIAAELDGPRTRELTVQVVGR